MRTSLAWLNLAHNKTRTVLAVAGVVFAVVLIFMQLGFLGSAQKSARLVYDALDFDVLIRSPRYLHVVDARTFPRSRLYQAAGVRGVRRVTPYYLASGYWRNPKTRHPRVILMMGVAPAQAAFTDAELQEKSQRLTNPEFVLIDRQSRYEFGPQDGKRFGDRDIGVETDAGRAAVRIVGTFSLGTGFVADGAILMNDAGFSRACPYQSLDDVNLGLVKLDDPTAVDAVVAELHDMLPDDVAVLTRDEAITREVNHFVYHTSIGSIFLLGVGVAFVVGAAIVYQVLSSDVASHLAEYATLKAIGYGGKYLAGVVLQQALIFAVLGFVPGALIAEALYLLTHWYANVPIGMDLERMGVVLVLSMGMCTISALGALRKVATADPADLF